MQEIQMIGVASVLEGQCDRRQIKATHDRYIDGILTIENKYIYIFCVHYINFAITHLNI